jgi:hypothetical protein
MLLNLIRYPILSSWIEKQNELPGALRNLNPFLGISINLQRSRFHIFGSRFFSKPKQLDQVDMAVELSCASDYINHFLFLEFLKAMELCIAPTSRRFVRWLELDVAGVNGNLRNIGTWDCWKGYYGGALTLDDLKKKCMKRLSAYMDFLNTNIDELPTEILSTKVEIGTPFHMFGNFLRDNTRAKTPLPLYVVIDQLEVLPQLNSNFGTELVRLINALLKQRDPVVFYKLGVRQYSWGNESRVSGADSTIENQRDYVIVNLDRVLMRKENVQWLFPAFAQDVALRRLKAKLNVDIRPARFRAIFGGWAAEDEARQYIKSVERVATLLKGVPIEFRTKLLTLTNSDPLETHLAAAWLKQQIGRKKPNQSIWNELPKLRWRRQWWRKERVGNALVQIASAANQTRKYYGWKPLLYLSGGNISAYLLIVSKCWDAAAKQGINPLTSAPIPVNIQSSGIYAASESWLHSDKFKNYGGFSRQNIVQRLGRAIRRKIIGDTAISNPGHTGFSLSSLDFGKYEFGSTIQDCIQLAVSWAIFEEREHTSKNRHEQGVRKKWYLHPLLSPYFSIPYIRVKEPLYVSILDVFPWFMSTNEIIFEHRPYVYLPSSETVEPKRIAKKRLVRKRRNADNQLKLDL